MFCSPQSNQAAAIVYRKGVNCFEVTAGGSLLHNEWKDNLRTESYSYKEQKPTQCIGKQNYVMKMKKKKKKKKTLTIITWAFFEQQKNDLE